MGSRISRIKQKTLERIAQFQEDEETFRFVFDYLRRAIRAGAAIEPGRYALTLMQRKVYPSQPDRWAEVLRIKPEELAELENALGVHEVVDINVHEHHTGRPISG